MAMYLYILLPWRFTRARAWVTAPVSSRDRAASPRMPDPMTWKLVPPSKLFPVIVKSLIAGNVGNMGLSKPARRTPEMVGRAATE